MKTLLEIVHLRPSPSMCQNTHWKPTKTRSPGAISAISRQCLPKKFPYRHLCVLTPQPLSNYMISTASASLPSKKASTFAMARRSSWSKIRLWITRGTGMLHLTTCQAQCVLILLPLRCINTVQSCLIGNGKMGVIGTIIRAFINKDFIITHASLHRLSRTLSPTEKSVCWCARGKTIFSPLSTLSLPKWKPTAPSDSFMRSMGWCMAIDSGIYRACSTFNLNSHRV